jgi:predicted nucleic acid-binding Zn ribbon protein
MTDEDDEKWLLGQWQRRRESEPARIGDVVNQLLARRGYLQTLSVEELREAWSQAAGKDLAAETCPGRLRGGVLEVFAVNSALLQELTFCKTELLKKLASVAPQFKIRDLRFRLGALG